MSCEIIRGTSNPALDRPTHPNVAQHGSRPDDEARASKLNPEASNYAPAKGKGGQPSKGGGGEATAAAPASLATTHGPSGVCMRPAAGTPITKDAAPNGNDGTIMVRLGDRRCPRGRKLAVGLRHADGERGCSMGGCAKAMGPVAVNQYLNAARGEGVAMESRIRGWIFVFPDSSGTTRSARPPLPPLLLPLLHGRQADTAQDSSAGPKGQHQPRDPGRGKQAHGGLSTALAGGGKNVGAHARAEQQPVRPAR